MRLFYFSSSREREIRKSDENRSNRMQSVTIFNTSSSSMNIVIPLLFDEDFFYIHNGVRLRIQIDLTIDWMTTQLYEKPKKKT